MCCLFATLVLAGPRLGIIVWGLWQPARWEATFDTFIWPLLGFLFLPWTTLMYVSVAPGGVDGFDWFWIGLAVVFDIMSYGASAYGNRDTIKSYSTPTPPPAAA